jgi:hypothetical protein
MIQDKLFFDNKDPDGINYDTPFTVYGSYNGRLWSKEPEGDVKWYTQTNELEALQTAVNSALDEKVDKDGGSLVNGSIDNTPIGQNSPADGRFTELRSDLGSNIGGLCSAFFRVGGVDSGDGIISLEFDNAMDNDPFWLEFNVGGRFNSFNARGHEKRLINFYGSSVFSTEVISANSPGDFSDRYTFQDVYHENTTTVHIKFNISAGGNNWVFSVNGQSRRLLINASIQTGL